jgi:hypothetical protein
MFGKQVAAPLLNPAEPLTSWETRRRINPPTPGQKLRKMLVFSQSLPRGCWT